MPSLPSSSQRVSYRNGLLLDASDFQQEQLYHRGRLALALAHLHGSGTLAGLRVEHDAGGEPGAGGEPSPEQIVVHPGVALDRAGRLLEIPDRQCLRLNRWFDYHRELPGAALRPFRGSGNRREFIGDLFLGFKECARALRPGFPEPAADATDAVVPARLSDSFELRLVARDCDPENELPPSPASRFPTLPADRAALLAAVYAAYPPAVPREYPPGFADRTAVFLCRVRLRLEDAPSTAVVRHASRSVTIDDSARPIVPAADLLSHLLST